MQIHTQTGGVAATNAYLIADETTGEAVLFDAPDHTVAPLLDDVQQRGWRLVGLWLTHGHFDHLADHALVTQRFPEARLLIHHLDEPKLIEPGSRFFPLPFTIPPRRADAYVEDAQVLKLGTLPVQVIHTPGHSPGHVMYHFPRQQLLVGGDLIIMNAVGRTDLPDSDPAQLDASIRRIMQLPPATRLLPGHGPASMLKDESETNLYVRRAMELS
jgi:glyoxylase-like metal-dependent hydrolase (beta-lactamase superfamily II)